MPSDFTFPVEAGHCMLFARALGDENPVYHDAEYARTTELGDIIAPPTFERASTHWNPDARRPKPGQPWHGSAAGPTGLPQSDDAAGGGRSVRGLHAEQRYIYHRPVRAGETLTVRVRPGKTWEKEGKRAGKMIFAEQISELFDEAGKLVVTATSVGVITSRAVDP
jgi:acyl dehydratase